MFYLQQSYGVLYSPCCNNFRCAYHELRQSGFYLIDHDKEKATFLSNYLLPTQKMNLLQEKSCLPNSQISIYLLMKQSCPYYQSKSGHQIALENV